MTVRWAARARADLAEIHRFIAGDSPQAAERVVQAIVAAGRRLVQFPKSGRVVPESLTRDIREVVASPYRILYVIRERSVYVLGVIHSKREMASVLKARREP
jgi:plasmid stabilization system protein ParE